MNDPLTTLKAALEIDLFSQKEILDKKMISCIAAIKEAYFLSLEIFTDEDLAVEWMIKPHSHFFQFSPLEFILAGNCETVLSHLQNSIGK